MATFIASDSPPEACRQINSAPLVRRHIDSQARRARKILIHAIKYLTNNGAREGGAFCAKIEQLEAVGLLMELNRQIYCQISDEPTLRDRCLSILRPHRVWGR